MSTKSQTIVNPDEATVFIQNHATSTRDWISSEVEIIWESTTEIDPPKQTALRDCFVQLHDIADILAEGSYKPVLLLLVKLDYKFRSKFFFSNPTGEE